MYETLLDSLEPKVKYTKTEAFVPSFMEVWVFYQVQFDEWPTMLSDVPTGRTPKRVRSKTDAQHSDDDLDTNPSKSKRTTTPETGTNRITKS